MIPLGPLRTVALGNPVFAPPSGAETDTNILSHAIDTKADMKGSSVVWQDSITAKGSSQWSGKSVVDSSVTPSRASD